MKSCVFVGNLVVLKNECPNQEIIFQMDLKQVEPFYPFPFLLVTRGLSGLVVRVQELGLYSRFEVWNYEFVMYLLLYVDDTLMVIDPSLCLKAIIKCFERALSLRVNFFKSSLIGVSVYLVFLSSTKDFIFCKITSLHFKYLRMLVRFTPRLDPT